MSKIHTEFDSNNCFNPEERYMYIVCYLYFHFTFYFDTCSSISVQNKKVQEEIASQITGQSNNKYSIELIRG